MDFKFDVFLSYSHADEERIRQIGDHMRNQGLKVWKDTWSAPHGESFPSAIAKGLETSRILVAFLSFESVKSEWASLERYLFLNQDPIGDSGRLIVALLDNCDIPFLLKTHKYIDFRAGFEVGIQDLMSVSH